MRWAFHHKPNSYTSPTKLLLWIPSIHHQCIQHTMLNQQSFMVSNNHNKIHTTTQSNNNNRLRTPTQGTNWELPLLLAGW
jgi:hypothetical protein